MFKRSTFICLVALFTLFVAHPAATCFAQLSVSASSEELAEFVDQKLSIELQNGMRYEDATPLRVLPDKKGEKPPKLRVKLDKGGSRTWSLAAIRKMTRDGKVVYENLTSGSFSEKQLSKRELAKQRAEQEHRKWLGRLTARGVKPWKKFTEAEHQAAIEKHKARYEAVAKLLPSLQLVETEHFLFCTNIPPQQVGGYVQSLDRMYQWMKQTYGMSEEDQVWRGKASVFAFVREEEFAAFERQFFQNQIQSGTAGLCHSDSRGNICISVHQGNSADYFGVVLVHETSHGFIHCYKTPVRVPSWVNEGMAEVIASLMVPSSKGVQRKEKKFLEALQSVPYPRLGEEFFVENDNIPFNRYGGATSMTRFLLQSSQANYVRFINLLKEGMPWEEALNQSYRANKEQLVTSYGRWLGVPNLQP